MAFHELGTIPRRPGSPSSLHGTGANSPPIRPPSRLSLSPHPWLDGVPNDSRRVRIERAFFGVDQAQIAGYR
jgi:hypothetical protein